MEVKTEEVSVEKAESPKKKKNSNKSKVAIIISILIVSTLLLGYAGGSLYFKDRFLPYTQIEDIDCGYLKVEEAEAKLMHKYRTDFTLTLEEDGAELLVLTADDMGMQMDFSNLLEDNLRAQNIFWWPIAMIGRQTQAYRHEFQAEYDGQELEKILDKAGIFEEAERKAPENAYIGEYNAELQGFEIVPETEGTKLDIKMTLQKAGEAIMGLSSVLKLREADCYQKADILSDNAELAATLAAMNKMAGTRISYDWNGNETILDGNIIHTWVLQENGEVSLDTEQVTSYVEAQAKAYDTYGKKRDFTTVQGIELSLRSGAYGWKTDKAAESEALAELIREGTVTEREPIYSVQGYVKGSNDIGTSYVEIDLTNQHLYLFIEGENVLETDFVSGDAAGGHLTPSGVFGITYKTRDAVLRGPDYETPVKYWMPFNGDVGMHDATWRGNFGGEIYLTNGSHGCINLPLAKAKEIYEYMKKSFPVICYYY